MDLCVRNETSVSAECVGAQTDPLQIGTANGSLGTSNISHDISNVSTALTPQRTREKGEWTRAQLEPTATLQINPKTRIFAFRVKVDKTQQQSPPNKREGTINSGHESKYHESREESLVH